jgi:HK97 family phage major capsid protein
MNPKVQELRARIAEIEAELRTIHETAGDEPLDEERTAKWDELDGEREAAIAELETLEARLAKLEQFAKHDENTERGDANQPVRGAPEVMKRVDPFDDIDVRSMKPHEARDRALKALDTPELTEHLTDAKREQLNGYLRKHTQNLRGSDIARRLLVTEHPDYHSAFVKGVSRTNPAFTTDEVAALERYEEVRAMSIGTDAAGGFGVPVLIDPTILLTAQESPNDIIRLARVETITNDEWKGVSSPGVTWSFDAEAAEVSDDSPTLAQPNVVAHKAQGFIPYSIEVGMDYPNFAAEMSTLLNEGYLELLASALTTGSGTNQPFGIVTALDANTNVELTPTTDGAFGAVDLYRTWDALPIKYRNRGDRVAWMSSTDVMNEVRQFGATLGSSFTVDLTEEAVPRLFGRRYFVNDYMADFTGTTGASNLLVLGDWQNYLVAQRAGMSVELVPHLLHTSNNRPMGTRGWYAWARIGADSINDLGFILLQNA